MGSSSFSRCSSSRSRSSEDGPTRCTRTGSSRAAIIAPLISGSGALSEPTASRTMSQSMLRHRGGQVIKRCTGSINGDGAVRDDPVFDHLHNRIFQLVMRKAAGLLRSFLRIQHRTTLVLSALGTGTMGKLLLMAVRALRKTGRSQEIVGTAIGGAARRVAPFRIRHGAIPFAFFPIWTALDPNCTTAGGERLKIIVLWTLSCCATLKEPPSEDPIDLPHRSNPGCCDSGRTAGKVLCSHPCTAS